MAKITSILIIAILCTSAIHYAYAQGCSDAGFCTVNSFKPNHSAKVLKNQFRIGAFFGRADNAIAVYGNYLEYNRQLSSKFGPNVKLTTLAQEGNRIATFGLSDIFVNANYKAGQKLQITLGAKMPLSDANKKNNGNLPLPMDYQASLGTFDLIFGIGYEIGKVQLVAALQQPLTQNNNQFMIADYPSNSKLRTFQSTNQFQRSADVLLRLSYPISISPRLKITPSILPIYHLANDKYTDELSNTQKEIENSQGLTLNANIFLDYEISNTHSLQINLGRPFIVREARPDGLTRSLIVNLEYSLRL